MQVDPPPAAPVAETFPRVSVVVPIHNGEKDVADLVACLRAQTYPRSRAEYIVVDNCSSDETARLLSGLAAEEKNLRLLLLSENKTRSSYAARNTGCRSASGEIIAFTDADCRPAADWLQELVKPFADPRVGIVAGKVEALPGRSLLEQYAAFQNLLSQEHTLAHSYRPYGQTANLAVRRQALREVGLFRPRMDTGGDADICWRIQQAGSWELSYCAQSVVRHRHRSDLLSFKQQMYRYGRSARYLSALYNLPAAAPYKPSEIAWRLCRWLLKEIPSAAVGMLAGKTRPVELVATPICLIGRDAYCRGQREAVITEGLFEIERFDEHNQ